MRKTAYVSTAQQTTPRSSGRPFRGRSTPKHFAPCPHCKSGLPRRTNRVTHDEPRDPIAALHRQERLACFPSISAFPAQKLLLIQSVPLMVFSAAMELRGKVAIVTGSGGKGSGRAEAVRLAADGCQVVVSDINEAGGRQTVRMITEAGGKAAFCRCDVSRADEVQALVAFAEKTFGGLDILINNASGPYRPGAPPDDWLS